MTTSEHCYHGILMLLLAASVLGILWSIALISESSANIRERELDLYEADELAWNNTYLHQMKGIDVKVIKDGFLYNRHLNDIETSEILIGALETKLGLLVGSQSKKDSVLEAEIAEEKRKLEYLRAGLDDLRVPLNLAAPDAMNPENHLLNQLDSQGDIPEYEPYSFFTNEYAPLAKWEKSLPGAKEQYSEKPPFTIDNKEEFIEGTKVLKNILLEITEKGLLGAQQPQILTLPDVPMLKTHKLQQHQKPKARLKHCQSIHGDYLEKTRTCTQYLWAEEICLKISKSNITNKW